MRSIIFLRKPDINYRKINERIKEPAGSKSYGKEDTVKETQEGCLSRPIRIKSELFLKVQIFKQTGKNAFLTVCTKHLPADRCFVL